jgi:peptidoglycan/LPS O-acetylase OafA/YrhL
MYRRIALAAAALGLAAGGMLMVWVVLRPHADLQRIYGTFLGFAALLVGGVQLAGAMRIPASAGQGSWRRLRPRWPVVLGVVVIALVTAGVGMAAAVAITSPDPRSGPQPVHDLQPTPDTVSRRPAPAPDTAPDTLPRRPP